MSVGEACDISYFQTTYLGGKFCPQALILGAKSGKLSFQILQLLADLPDQIRHVWNWDVVFV